MRYSRANDLSGLQEMFQDTIMQTSPPQKRRFNGLLNQWLIYDKYMAYEIAKERLEEADQKVDQSLSKQIRKRLSEPEPEDPKGVMLEKMMKCAKVLERMINQNNHDEIAQGNFKFFWSWNYIFAGDFKFYDDGADEFRENEGSLLPLWKFSFSEASQLDNTALCWSPAYSDLFAASFGSCRTDSSAERNI